MGNVIPSELEALDGNKTRDRTDTRGPPQNKVKLSETQADFFQNRRTFVLPEENFVDAGPHYSWDPRDVSSVTSGAVDAVRAVGLIVGLNYTETNYPLQGAVRDADLFTQALEKLSFQVRRGNGSTVNFFATLDDFANEIATGRIHPDVTICIAFFGHTTQVGDVDALVFTDALLTEADLRRALGRPVFEHAEFTIILDTSLVWTCLPHEYRWPPRDTHLCPPPPTRAFAKRFVPLSKVRLRQVCSSIFTHPPTPVDLIVFTPSETVDQNAIELVASGSDNQIRGAFTFALCKVLREKLRFDRCISYEALVLAVREQLWRDIGEIHQPSLTVSKAASVTRPYLNFLGHLAGSQTTESFGSHAMSGDSHQSTCSSNNGRHHVPKVFEVVEHRADNYSAAGSYCSRPDLYASHKVPKAFEVVEHRADTYSATGSYYSRHGIGPDAYASAASYGEATPYAANRLSVPMADPRHRDSRSSLGRNSLSSVRRPPRTHDYRAPSQDDLPPPPPPVTYLDHHI